MFVAAMVVACIAFIASTKSWWWPASIEPGPPAVGPMTWTDSVQEALRAGDAIGPPLMSEGLFPQPNNVMLIHPGDQPLDGEPGGLPTHPEATPVTGFRRRAGGKVEEVAIRRIAGATIQTVQAFYDSAAIDAGFARLTRPSNPGGGSAGERATTPTGTGDANGRPTSTLYARTGRLGSQLDQILTVRVSASSGSDNAVRVLLWFQRPQDSP